MTKSSKQLAKEWPYPRHKNFEATLRKSASNWFLSKGFSTHSKMPYCLDKLENWQQNIILPEVADYIQNERQKSSQEKDSFPLHKYAHHGLSSQAMVFNLVGPLIKRNDLSPLIKVLGNKDVSVDIANAEFEFDDRDVFNEDSGQPTSLDLVLLDQDEKPVVFIESKLVESEFGGCSVFEKGDCSGKNPLGELSECYLDFIGRRYWELIEEYGFDEKLRSESICVLVNYYQFFREILFSLKKNGVFVLLYDERSPVFYLNKNGKERGLIPMLKQFVPEKHHDKIILMSVQEVVESIKESNVHDDWIGEFELKYGFVENTK